MKLISMKCSGCGSALECNPSLKQIQCNYCGMVTMIDDEIIRVEHSLKDDYLEKYQKAYNYLFNFRDYDKAYEFFEQVVVSHPELYDCYWYMVICLTKNFTCYFFDRSKVSLFLKRYSDSEKNADKLKTNYFIFNNFELNCYYNDYCINKNKKYIKLIKKKIKLLDEYNFSKDEICNIIPNYFDVLKKIKNTVGFEYKYVKFWKILVILFLVFGLLFYLFGNKASGPLIGF